MQRHEPVAEAADHRRHDHEEHHDEAVARDEHVVHVAVGEILQPRLLQLEPHGDRQRAADEAADDREYQGTSFRCPCGSSRTASARGRRAYGRGRRVPYLSCFPLCVRPVSRLVVCCRARPGLIRCRASTVACSLWPDCVVRLGELAHTGLLERGLPHDALGLFLQLFLLLQHLLALFLVFLGAGGFAGGVRLLHGVGPGGEHLFLHDAHARSA